MPTRKGKGKEHSTKGSSRAFCCSLIKLLVNCTTTNCGTIIAKSQKISFLRKSHEYETCVDHHGCNHSHYSESQATHVCLDLKTPWHLYKLYFIRCTGWKLPNNRPVGSFQTHTHSFKNSWCDRNESVVESCDFLQVCEGKYSCSAPTIPT